MIIDYGIIIIIRFIVGDDIIVGVLTLMMISIVIVNDHC